jgi:CheY-like chemotaxis protein
MAKPLTPGSQFGERKNSFYHSILVVDDDVEDLELFEEALNEIGAVLQYATAKNGIDALEKLKDGLLPPEVIFIDINMPGMNGFELLMELKKNPRLKRIPVVILTTSSRTDDVTQAKDLGADLFITKPLDFMELCSKLKRVLTLDFNKPPKEFTFHLRRNEFF